MHYYPLKGLALGQPPPALGRSSGSLSRAFLLCSCGARGPREGAGNRYRGIRECGVRNGKASGLERFQGPWTGTPASLTLLAERHVPNRIHGIEITDDRVDPALFFSNVTSPAWPLVTGLDQEPLLQESPRPSLLSGLTVRGKVPALSFLTSYFKNVIYDTWTICSVL